MTDKIVVNAIGLEDVARDFLALPEQIESAKQRALRRTVSWIGTQSRRAIAAELAVKAAAVKGRIIPRFGQQTCEVFFGLAPIPAHLAGNISQSATGVLASGREFRGAFVGAITSAEEKAYIRLSSKHYVAELYPTAKGQPGGAARAKGRFPLAMARIPMDTPGVHGIIQGQAAAAMPRLKEVFAAELNYQTNVKGGA